MTTLFNQRRLGGKAARASALCLLALAAALLQAREARAQWTAPDAGGNINTTGTGNVGIGTATPTYPITIVKDQAGATTVAAFNATDGAGAQASVGVSRTLNWSNKYISFGVTAPSYGVAGFNDTAYFHSKGVPLKFGSESADDLLFFTNGINNTRMTISGGGNVGIGTTAPSDRLEINGNVVNGAGLTVSTAGGAKFRTGTVGTTVPNWGGQLINAKFDQAAGNWTLDDTSLNAAFLKLDLRPYSYANEIGFYRMASGANPRPDNAWAPMAQFKLDTGNVLLAASNGNVGVGTTAPIHKLDVGGNMTIGSGYTSSVMVPANGLIVQGGVGIGTPNPDAAYKLDVNGDIRVSGNINAKYQDVAEWVPSTQKLPAGTVVVLDTKNANHVAASHAAYDTRVAGVVSAQPGITLGEGGEGKVLVATTGRVKVKVDATRAAIQIGDLIVTSDAEGVGMKSEPIQLGGRQFHAPGTIIGKALEPLATGTGEILVLLSLQ